MRDEFTRVPPHSVEAEQAVLGGLMLIPAAMDVVAGLLTEADFYRREHQLIFRAMRDLHAKNVPCDAVTLAETLEQSGVVGEVGGIGYVIQLANETPSAANINAYAKIVREKAVRRSLIDIGNDLLGQAFGDGDGLAIADAAVRRLMDLAKSSTSHESTLKEALREAIQETESAFKSGGKIRGVPTGIDRLDKRLGGFHPGDLIIFGARPAMGKTALLLNLADSASQTVPVGVISGEQPKMQLGQRMLSMNSRIAAELLRNGQLQEEHWPRLTAAVVAMHDRNWHIYDRSAPTLDELCRIARKWRRQHGIKALFVDYIQRIRVPGADRIQEVSECGRTLKDLARDLDIPVIALAQVKGEVDKRSDKRPMQSDLANSDELTREADIIVMLYRDEVYNPNSPDRGIAELLVEKNRHGPLGVIKTAWLGETMRFENLAEWPDAA